MDRLIRPATEAPRTMAASVRIVADMVLGKSTSLVSHGAEQRTVEVQATVDGRDLDAMSRDIEAAIATLGSLPKGTRVHLRDQSESVFAWLQSLAFGVILVSLLVYLLLAALYQ